jgi:hypothetical protein
MTTNAVNDDKQSLVGESDIRIDARTQEKLNSAGLFVCCVRNKCLLRFVLAYLCMPLLFAGVARVVVGRRPLCPDGGWGWVVVFGSFLIHTCTDGFVYSFGVIMHELLEHYDGGHAFTSCIVSSLIAVTLGIGKLYDWRVLAHRCWVRTAGPIAGAITNQYGCRATTIAGALIASFGCAISYFATSIVFLMFSLGLIMGKLCVFFLFQLLYRYWLWTNVLPGHRHRDDVFRSSAWSGDGHSCVWRRFWHIRVCAFERLAYCRVLMA